MDLKLHSLFLLRMIYPRTFSIHFKVLCITFIVLLLYINVFSKISKADES